MQLIVPLLSTNNLNSNGYNNQLDQIDEQIGMLATAQYKNDIFGFKEPVDLDYYDILCDQKEVLLNLYMGCDCSAEGNENCYNASSEAGVYGAPIVVPQNVISVLQFIVGNIGGPTNGSTVFVIPSIAGHPIALALQGSGPLAIASSLSGPGDYFYDPTTGTITLIGRLFNTGELYEILVY